MQRPMSSYLTIPVTWPSSRLLPFAVNDVLFNGRKWHFAMSHVFESRITVSRYHIQCDPSHRMDRIP